MPWTKGQLSAMGLALAAKRGKVKVGELRGAAKSFYKSMTEKELAEHIKEGKK